MIYSILEETETETYSPLERVDHGGRVVHMQ